MFYLVRLGSIRKCVRDYMACYQCQKSPVRLHSYAVGPEHYEVGLLHNGVGLFHYEVAQLDAEVALGRSSKWGRSGRSGSL